MKKRFFYLHVVSLFMIFWGCSTKNPAPSLEAVTNKGCLFDNRQYCGWSISVSRNDRYFLTYMGEDTIVAIIGKDRDDTLSLGVYPRGRYDSSYHVAYSLYKKLTSIADALYSDLDYYANPGDTNGHFRFARMDFYNKDYDTNITLFQIDSACFSKHDIKLKSVTKDWYTFDRQVDNSYSKPPA
ncbi:MAG: hypothetical protein J6X62_07070 [Bacteroidales bacterium]|nr:hypothetical protein [Bacteroidales bacterium]